MRKVGDEMDREKVIKGLEELYGFLFREYANIPAEESKIYYDRFKSLRDAISMLKEQRYEYEKGFNDAMQGKRELMYEGIDGKWHKKDWR